MGKNNFEKSTKKSPLPSNINRVADINVGTFFTHKFSGYEFVKINTKNYARIVAYICFIVRKKKNSKNAIHVVSN